MTGIYTNTAFPGGFQGGLTLFGAPLTLPGDGLPASTKYLFVSSVLGATGNTGAYDSPLNSVDRAMDYCVANQNYIIVCLPGHAETLTAAGGITMDVAGVTVVGLGNGNDRPRFTFGTATSASWLITAANCRVLNVVGIAGIDGLTNPFHVQAAGFTFSIEWQDGSATVEALRAILTTAAADNLTGALVYRGFSAGNATVNAIRLVGVNDARLYVDYYGILTTGVVEMITTACTNVNVTGTFYVSGTTNLSLNVVDTVGTSTWAVQGFDAAAAASFSGGSAAAVASDDVAALSAKIGTPVNSGGTATIAAILGDPANVSIATYVARIGTITNAGGTASVGAILGDFANTTLVSKLNAPSADSTNNVNVAEVAGNKTDAAVYVPGTTKSVLAYTKGTADLQERVAVKSAAVIVNGDTLFTVTGGFIEVLALFSECVTGNDATASTLQYSATPTVGSATTISGASASLANAVAGATVTLAGTALSTAALLSATGPNLIANPGTVLVPAGIITAVVAVGSTTGTWRHYIRYKPLQTGVTVA